jgi:hypothetical protein
MRPPIEQWRMFFAYRAKGAKRDSKRQHLGP